MRSFKYVLFIVMIGILMDAVFASSQQQTGDLDKRINDIVQLEEVLKIEQVDESFFLIKVDDIKAADNGCIFVEDDKQLLQFKPDGTFVRNYFKRGVGPGEAPDIFNFYLDKDKLVMTSSKLKKILVFNYNTGTLLKEFHLEKGETFKTMRLFHVSDDYYFWSEDPQYTKGKMLIKNVVNNVIKVTKAGKILGKQFSITMKYIQLKGGGLHISYPWADLLECRVNDDVLFLSYTTEYKIHRYNIAENKIEKSFGRKFERIKVTAENLKYTPGNEFRDFQVNNKKFSVPEPDYLPDIRKLLIYKEILWVMTSRTKDGNKVLMDVFNLNGNYVRSFYLVCPEGVNPNEAGNWIRFIDRAGNVYTSEVDDDDNPVIKKYRVKN